MKKFIIYIAIILIFFVVYNQSKYQDIKSNQNERNKEIIRNAIILENKITKHHKAKYSGYFIDNNGKIIILHTGLNRNTILEYKKLVNSKEIMFKMVKFSFSKLKSVKNIVQENTRLMTDDGVKISSVKINIANNPVQIGLYGKINTEKKKFLKYFDKEHRKNFQFVYEERAIIMMLKRGKVEQVYTLNQSINYEWITII